MKMSEKICFMILIGISIFLISIFDVKAVSITDLSDFDNETAVPIDNRYYSEIAHPSVGIETLSHQFSISYVNTTHDYLIFNVINTFGLTNKIGYSTACPSNGGPCVSQLQDITISYETRYNLIYDDNGTEKQFLCDYYPNSGYVICNNPKKPLKYLQTYVFMQTPGYTYSQYENELYWYTNYYNVLIVANGNQKTIVNNTTDIKNKMNEDIDNDSKTAPNQDEYDQAKQKENTIINGISGASPDDITFTQDINATGTIWNLIDNIVNTNAKIIGLIISILSIGLIKLILAR